MRSLWAVLLLCTSISTSAQLFLGECLGRNTCTYGECMPGPFNNTFWCRCGEGVGGDYCEKRCSLKCGNNQKCGFTRNGDEICQCQGLDCFPLKNASKINPCSQAPCNNGRCVSFNDGFMCICNDGFGGSYCENGRNFCAANQCDVGSRCVNHMSGSYCECAPGRVGDRCDWFDCNRMPDVCIHGKCLANPLADKKFECICEEGFEGETCNKDKNECLVPDVCLNNGKCVNLPGSYKCDCPRGFAGKHCESRVNMCLFHQCENNGSCVHTEMQEPVCQCKNGFVGKKCEKKCPPGYGGLRCELPLNVPACSRNGASCWNGGKCIAGFCVCPPDFVGNHCELSRSGLSKDNTCRSDPCMNNANCTDVDAHIGYVCSCKEGFEGDICERRKDVCAEKPCANGGKCQKTQDSFECVCPSGFEGKRCEKKEKLSCAKHPCVNGGICENSGLEVKCQCPYGFTGPKCEERIVLTEPRETVIREICERRNCSLRAGNGICDEECNQAACHFDGGDCSGGQQPFAKCPYAAKCADVFGNGICNQECNNEECLWDGMDCMSSVTRCPLKIREHCSNRFADGVCDRECNSIGCGFDGGDCETNRTEVIILTDIRLKIQMDPLDFQDNGGQTLMDISSALRTTVRIQRDEEGPLVFVWDGHEELGRVEMNIKKLTDQKVISPHVRKARSLYTIQGIVLYLEVEEVCQTECRFTTAQSVVDLISAGLTKTNGRTSLGLPITEAIVATPKKSGGSGWSRNQILLVVIIAFLAFGTVVAGVIVKTNEPQRSRKRKMVNAPVWMPPMDPELEKGRRNQSSSSSQRSLLDTTGRYEAKRHRGEYEGDYDGGHYQQIYPQTLANGFAGNGAYLGSEQEQFTQSTEYPPDQIPLHVEASGSGHLVSPLTEESVNQIGKYNRRVLHFLAANTNGKPEVVIKNEAKMCISAGAEVNARDCDENTALMLAVKARRVPLALVLMHAGGNPAIFNNSHRSALHEAVVTKNPRMVEVLLNDKRLVKEIDELDRNGMTALMLVAQSESVCQVEMANMLLSKGAKIDCDGAARKESPIYRGRTALHYAALVDNMPMVEFLVKRNSNKDKQDEDGKTPLMLAAKEGHENAVNFLVASGASLTTVDAKEKTAAQLAQANYHHEVAEYLRQMNVVRNRDRQESLRQQMTAVNSHGGKGRQTFKAIKKAASQRTPAPNSVSSRESNHLTPPPSDGSFSSPSPHFFHTTSSTPNYLESSPEHGYHSDMTSNPTTWYSSPSPYPDNTYHHMPPGHVYSQPEHLNNSFYC